MKITEVEIIQALQRLFLISWQLVTKFLELFLDDRFNGLLFGFTQMRVSVVLARPACSKKSWP